MAGHYPDDDNQFAGLVEAATAAAEHQRDLGKRKRGEENAYIPISSDLTLPFQESKPATLSNSAAVLFREPSEKSKKYSRPPLGKVFTSLELAPDAFLKLQSAAKDYMLSEEFPERKDVVGHKKANGNNDHAKLKLYECVQQFLQENEYGETFFGHSSNTNGPDAPPRTFFWPEDQSRIIKLLMPLLRKMVTNERQRLYAAESRKGDSRKSSTRSPGGRQDEDDSFNREMVSLMAGMRPNILTSTQVPEIDPTLQTQTDIPQPTMPDALSPPTARFPNTLNMYVNIMSYENGDGRNLLPEFVLPNEKITTFEQFLSQLQYVDLGRTLPQIKAFLPQGLVVIRDEEEWLSAKMTALQTLWMNQRLVIVVEC